MNTADIIIIIVLAAWLIFAAVRVVKKRKNAKCDGNCAACGKSCE